MKLNWNFLGEGGGGTKQKIFHGGSMDIFWNCTIRASRKYLDPPIESMEIPMETEGS